MLPLQEVSNLRPRDYSLDTLFHGWYSFVKPMTVVSQHTVKQEDGVYLVLYYVLGAQNTECLKTFKI